MRCLLPCFLSIASCTWLALPSACLAGEPTPLESAHPMVGTATFGHTYPGATVPFGMVQLSPDTGLTGWEHCSGYHYEDKAILGFSHNHLSGTGCPDLGDIRITPLGPTPPPQNKEGYLCPFSHKDEIARPGYYSVLLQNPKVKVELTATAHAGFHKYSFSGGQTASLVFDLVRGIANEPAGVTMGGAVVVEKDNVLSGYRRSKGWAADKTCFFVAEFSRPFDAVGIEVDGKPVKPGEVVQGKGRAVTAARRLQELAEPILVKVGISGVSVEAARKNLAAEIPAWDFQERSPPPQASWNDMLGRVEIEAIDPATREIFYTAPVSRRHGPHALQRRRRQLSRLGPQGPWPGRLPELLHVLVVGHVPGGARVADDRATAAGRRFHRHHAGPLPAVRPARACRSGRSPATRRGA